MLEHSDHDIVFLDEFSEKIKNEITIDIKENEILLNYVNNLFSF